MTPRPFSEDLWDYLGDMPYLPGRADRDALLSLDDGRRVRIWDFFFRIQPEDVGKPQQAEIKAVRETLDAVFAEHQELIDRIQQIQARNQKADERKIRRNLIIGFPTVFLGTLFAFLLLYRFSIQPQNVLICGAIFWVAGFGALTLAGLRFMQMYAQANAVRAKLAEIESLKKHQERAARNRIAALELEIEALRRQIPEPPSGAQVRAWLNEDLELLQARSVEKTGVGERLVVIEELNASGLLYVDRNPIRVMGPGELQDEERIPQTFASRVNRDLNKHLSARKAFVLADGHTVDVLYGVYYIKYVAIAGDMLATYSLFFDCITGKASGERVTEQYYRDVIAITTTREPRRIMLGVDSEEYIFVDDAPTFTISLSDSETRELTFVNQNYFMALRDKLALNSEQVRNIYWIEDVDRLVEDTVELLRRYLRAYKGGNNG